MNWMSKFYYITTPIYYVNSVPHIGTALTTLASDVTARFQRMRGRPVHFLTGTDENATKVAEAARKAGKDPKEFVDEVSEEFIRIWRELKISYDDFIRTTEPRHIRVVQEVFDRLREAGYVYLGEYEGWYDVVTETFYKDSELINGKSPDGNEVRWVKEENYFFRLSAFGDRLLAHIEADPDFIQPEPRKNEVVSFIKQGLRDACITRTNTGWGIPVPEDESKVIYVWFDALLNYISAIGYPDGNWHEFWPADIQWMGKDILVRFHATLWPAMLMGLGLPLPRTLMGHGWMLMGEHKISKSKGNVVAPLDLAENLAHRAGCSRDSAIDAVRYYMAITLPYEEDARFTSEHFDAIYDGNLVNDFSNGVHRVISMLNSFTGGSIPSGSLDEQVVRETRAEIRSIEEAYERLRLDQVGRGLVRLAHYLNETIDRTKPWDLHKNKDAQLSSVMRTLAYLVRTLEGAYKPVMPGVADRIASLLALPPLTQWDDVGSPVSIPESHRVAEPEPIFPRLQQKEKIRTTSEKQETPTMDDKPFITFDEFQKLDLRIATVTRAERIPNTSKLLKIELLVGEEKRTVVAGIAEDYDPGSLIGKQVVYLANLEPKKLRGVESQGMILAAETPEGSAILLQPEKEAPSGARVR
jgi:methionyl-tRNA synthetase